MIYLAPWRASHLVMDLPRPPVPPVIKIDAALFGKAFGDFAGSA